MSRRLIKEDDDDDDNDGNFDQRLPQDLDKRRIKKWFLFSKPKLVFGFDNVSPKGKYFENIIYYFYLSM